MYVLLQPKIVVEKKKPSAVNGRPTVSTLAKNEQKMSSISPSDCRTDDLSLATINNFSELLLEVYKTCYYDSMKALWSTVLSETVSDYCTKWRKRKRWFGSPVLSASSISIESDVRNIDGIHKSSTETTEIVCMLL